MIAVEKTGVDSELQTARRLAHGRLCESEFCGGLGEGARRTADEPRWLLVGKIDEQHRSAIMTRRGDNIRLISVRRSRDKEAAIYESEDV